MNTNLQILVAIFIFLVSISSSFSLTLKVEYSRVKLPFSDSCHRLMYDGNDSIYIFGGCLPENRQRISKYSLANDTITSAGNLNQGFYYGSVHSTSNQSLLILSSRGFMDKKVINFNLTTNTNSYSTNLPWSVSAHPTILSQEKVIALGSPHTEAKYNIGIFDLKNYTFSQSSNKLPIDLWAAGWGQMKDRVFIFPYHNYGNGNVWEFNTSTHNLTPLGEPNLPILMMHPSVVSDNDNVYIIAGFNPKFNQTLSSHEGILQFDPKTNSTTFVPVENWPVKNGERYFNTGPQCVFVGKLDRIYCFGGWSLDLNGSGEKVHDEIFYIDFGAEEDTTANPTTEGVPMTTIDPNLFTCAYMPDGFYPHPSECALYFGCRNQTLYQFECPSPLLFNPGTKNCDFPENVTCHISCIGKENGHFPHPDNCSWFIVCDHGIAYVFKCAEGLLYDHNLHICNHPQNVNCP